MPVINSNESEMNVEVEPVLNNLLYEQKLSSQGGPSEAYEIFAFIGVALLAFDFITDLTVGIFTIVTGRFVQGFFTIVFIVFPMLYRKHKEEKGLLQIDKVYDEEDRFIRCKMCLPERIIDPIIWAYNHYAQTVLYRQDPKDEKKRREFYLSKLMAQLSLKNEARHEAYYQVILTFFCFIYYYDEYTVLSKILVIGSMIFSLISIARAACIDLEKTQRRYRKQPYPNQTLLWKISRLISMICAIIGRMIFNVVLVIYFAREFSDVIEGRSIAFDFDLVDILYITFSFLCEIWYLGIHNSEWERLLSEVNLCMSGNSNPRLHVSKSTIYTKMYIMVFCPFLFFYQPPPLEIYTFSIMRIILLSIINLVLVIVTLNPILWIIGLQTSLVIVLMSSIITSIVLRTIFTCISRMLTNHTLE